MYLNKENHLKIVQCLLALSVLGLAQPASATGSFNWGNHDGGHGGGSSSSPASFFDWDGSHDWKVGDTQNPSVHPKYLSTNDTFNVSIDYKLGSDWNVTSASLWLYATDDNGPFAHCSTNCSDVGPGSDHTEQALITKVEGGPAGSYGTAEIDGFAWYKLSDNFASYLVGGDNQSLELTLKAVNGDFWFKNAKLEVNYTLQAVPVPGAIWLFGSAVLGLVGFRKKASLA
jgi:hypothetical protein